MTPGEDPARVDELSAEGRELVRGFRDGRERALARAISLVEDEAPGFEAVLHALHGRTGRGRRIGITGPPGAGKSTLTAKLARAYRSDGLTVGILAVDPTSPFTGGALLGDRVRMTELATEPGVFIRSMASRGSVGGMATATREAADLLDAFGFDRILLETVGVGQSELDIAGSADSTVVVLVPESGDGIQAMKAGLMEVADLFVVNKADRPGAARLENEIRVMMAIRSGRALRNVPAHGGHHGAVPGAVRGEGAGRGPGGREEAGDGEPPGGNGTSGADGTSRTEASAWTPPVLRTTASTGEGVAELRERLDAHFAVLEETGALGRRRRAARLGQAREVLLRRVRRRALDAWEEAMAGLADRIAAGEVSPYEAADRVHRRLAGGDPGPPAPERGPGGSV